MTVNDPDRRTFLKASGGMLAATLVAGCSGGGGSEADDGGGGGGGDEADFGGWLDDANGDTGLADLTGESEVTIDVGAGSDGLAFGPAAAKIDAGTTVVWEWTGEGSDHDVTDSDGAFESELQGEEGDTFEHTFEEAGSYTYSCTPHEAAGMKGALEVVE